MTWLTIIGILVLICAAVAALVLVLPLSIEGDFRFGDGTMHTNLRAWWGAPWVVSVAMQGLEQAPMFRVLGRTLTKKDPVRESGGSAPPQQPSPPPASAFTPEPVPAPRVALSVPPQPPPLQAGPPPPPSVPHERPIRQREAFDAPPVDHARREAEPPRQDVKTNLRDSRSTTDDDTPPTKPSERGLRARWRRLRGLSKRRLAWALVKSGPVRNGTFTWLVRIVRAVVKILGLKSFRLHLAASLSDPAATGSAYGYWVALEHALALPASRVVDLRFDPVFDREYLSVDAGLCIRSSLFRILRPAVVMIVAFPYLSVIRVLWQESGRRTEHER